MKLYSLLLLLLSVIISYAQEDEKGVLISDKSHKAPVSSALLELESDSKGVLLPRMSYENMRAIVSPSDGLLVFVTGSSTFSIESRGFYFYDATIRHDWVRLESQSQSTYQAEPIGTIVGFSGDLSKYFDNGKGIGDYEGWVVCDGSTYEYNGIMQKSPDLTNRFLVGAASSTTYEAKLQKMKNHTQGQEYINIENIPNKKSDYNIVGVSSNPKATIRLSANQIPVHRHEPKPLTIVQVQHTHSLNRHSHFHTYERAAGTRGTEHFPQEAKDKRKNFHHTSVDESAVIEELPKDKVSTEDNIYLKKNQDFEMTINFPNESLISSGNENPAEFSNEPRYYVLVFIIKMNANEKVYEDKARNIEYKIYENSGASLYYSVSDNIK